MTLNTFESGDNFSGIPAVQFPQKDKVSTHPTGFNGVVSQWRGLAPSL
jgi:hypothetical protein